MIELTNLVANLHKIKIIHGDIRMETIVMIKQDPLKFLFNDIGCNHYYQFFRRKALKKYHYLGTDQSLSPELKIGFVLDWIEHLDFKLKYELLEANDNFGLGLIFLKFLYIEKQPENLNSILKSELKGEIKALKDI